MDEELKIMMCSAFSFILVKYTRLLYMYVHVCSFLKLNVIFAPISLLVFFKMQRSLSVDRNHIYSVSNRVYEVVSYQWRDVLLNILVYATSFNALLVVFSYTNA